MNVYTDPRLLDVAGALDALPSLPLDVEVEAETMPIAMSATGTDGRRLHRQAAELAPMLAPNLDKPCRSQSNVVKMTAGRRVPGVDGEIDVSVSPDKSKGPLTTPVNGPSRVGDTGLEPVTPSLSS